jgi:hypothetical protein
MKWNNYTNDADRVGLGREMSLADVLGLEEMKYTIACGKDIFAILKKDIYENGKVSTIFSVRYGRPILNSVYIKCFQFMLIDG